MVRLLREEDGWTILETLIVMPVLIFLLFAAVEYWGVLTIYQHTESLKYYALSKMEVNGGLPETEKEFLEAKLADLGADPETIRVTGDILDGGRKPVRWPNEVNLRIEFVPGRFDNFTARAILGGEVGKPVRIGVEGSAISQKIDED